MCQLSRTDRPGLVTCQCPLLVPAGSTHGLFQARMAQGPKGRLWNGFQESLPNEFLMAGIFLLWSGDISHWCCRIHCAVKGECERQSRPQKENIFRGFAACKRGEEVVWCSFQSVLNATQTQLQYSGPSGGTGSSSRTSWALRNQRRAEGQSFRSMSFISMLLYQRGEGVSTRCTAAPQLMPREIWGLFPRVLSHTATYNTAKHQGDSFCVVFFLTLVPILSGWVFVPLYERQWRVI